MTTSDDQREAAFLAWLADQPIPMVGDTFSLPKIEALLHSAWNAALSTRPALPAGDEELIAAAREWPRELEGNLINMLADALERRAPKFHEYDAVVGERNHYRDALEAALATRPSSSPQPTAGPQAADECCESCTPAKAGGFRASRQPQPGDGPDYHAEHAAWSQRQVAGERGKIIAEAKDWIAE